MNQKTRSFTSHISKGQMLAALLYLPVHIAVLPIAASVLMLRGVLDDTTGTFLIYAIGAVYMLLALWKFFRRDFDTLCDHKLNFLIEICVCYGLILVGNWLANLLFMQIGLSDSANNEAVIEMMHADFGPVAAMTVFLAPIVEESIFRAAIFGPIRRKNRMLAYIVSMLLFSLYHVWAYALDDPRELLYILEYLPASLLLARCYERTNSIWGSIFLHMLNNGITMWAMSAMM